LEGNFEIKGKEGTGLRKFKVEDHDDKIIEMKLRRTVLAEDTAYIKAIRKANNILRVIKKKHVKKPLRKHRRK